MFDLPASKRIRRSEVYSSEDDEVVLDAEEGPELRAQMEERLRQMFDVDEAVTVDRGSGDGDRDGSIGKVEDSPGQPHDKEDGGFEFRLFASSAAAATTTSTANPAVPMGPVRIQLVDDDEDGTALGGGGFVRRERLADYYFATRADGQRRAQLEAAAVSGEEVRVWSGKRCAGLEVPWRVVHVRVDRGRARGVVRSGETVEMVGEGGETRSRKKSGKKRRIVMRVRRRKVEEKKLLLEEEAKSKEEREKEKKKRLNGVKRAKKRAKDKARKAASAGV